METIRIKTPWGLFSHKMAVEADSSHVVIYKRRFPLFGKMVQVDDIPTGKLIFWGNTDDVEKSNSLWLSEDGMYESLPVSNEQLAEDDKDDWLFQNLGSSDDTAESLDDECDDEDLDADLHMYTSTYRLRLSHPDIVKLCSLLQEAGSVKASVRNASGLFLKTYIAFTEKWLFSVDGNEVDSVPIKEMAFFVRDNNRLYCGYHRQINAKINSIKVFNEIKDLCYSVSTRLADSGTNYKIGLFQPDYITLTDKAVVYTRKTFRKDEMAYVPYKRINLLMTTPGIFKKRISIFGEQNILPKHSLWIQTATELVEKIKDHGVKPETGESFYSSKIFPTNWFGRSPRVVCLDNSIVYYPNRLKGSEVQSQSEDGQLMSAMVHFSEISSVVWYKKTFSLFGTLEITGRPRNVRSDQNNNFVTMLIPQLWAFKFKWGIFKGKLFNVLKSKSSAVFDRIRDDYDFGESK